MNNKKNKCRYNIRGSVTPVKKTKQLLGKKNSLVKKKIDQSNNILSITITSVCTIKHLVEDKINIFNINNFFLSVYVHYLEQHYPNRRHFSQKNMSCN